MTAGSLTLAALAAALMAPCSSIVARRSTEHVLKGTRRFLLSIATIAVGLGLAVAALQWKNGSTEIAVPLTFIAAALGFAGVGAAFACAFSDPLDAAAASSVVSFTLTFALVFAGEAARQIPSQLLNIALTASPFTALASAANVDILREPTWYRLSPIAHQSFTYPVWSWAASWYLAAAGVCTGIYVWNSRVL